jgi:Ca2+-binding EF-hand superfamily protein
MFEVADENKNNVLEVDEFHHFTLFVAEAVSSLPLANKADSIDNMFEKFDNNQDGVLSWDEIW